MNHFNYPIGKARYEMGVKRTKALIRRDLLDHLADQSLSVRAASDAVVRAAAEVIAARNADQAYVVTDITSAVNALKCEVERLANMAAEAGNGER